MKKLLQRCGVVLAALVFFTGCNLLHIPFYLFGPEPKIPAKMKRLATDNDEETIHVAVLSYGATQHGYEFLNADREISTYFVKHLREWIKHNEENVKVVDPRKVEVFKNENPDWRALPLEEIAKELKVDYLVYLDVRKLKLTGRSTALRKASADIRVSLADLKDPDSIRLPARSFTYDYPKEGRAIDTFGVNEEEFKQQFFIAMTRRLAWWFTAHPTAKEYSFD